MTGRTKRVAWMRARTADAILLMALWTLTGCDAFAELRAFFHDDGSPPASADAKASLRVDVEPTDGISILLDGVRVGRSSPLHKTDIEPGHHSLEVRAMGYHPVLLPIALKPNHVLRLPVSLRPRHVRQALPRPRPPREAWVDPEAPPPPPSPPSSGGSGLLPDAVLRFSPPDLRRSGLSINKTMLFNLLRQVSCVRAVCHSKQPSCANRSVPRARITTLRVRLHSGSHLRK